jgi:hypothetical protein
MADVVSAASGFGAWEKDAVEKLRKRMNPKVIICLTCIIEIL